MKAILVIDEMPIKCEDCPLHYRKRQEIYRCEMTNKNVRLNSKPSWCPLKPMPNKQATNLAIGIDLVDGFKDGWNYGWNACIDEIIGDNNE